MRKLFILIDLVENMSVIKGRELAEKYNVSVRSIQRDIDDLVKDGYDIKATVGKSGGYYIAEMDAKKIECLLEIKRLLNGVMGV